jgi:hypothetical protein
VERGAEASSFGGVVLGAGGLRRECWVSFTEEDEPLPLFALSCTLMMGSSQRRSK